MHPNVFPVSSASRDRKRRKRRRAAGGRGQSELRAAPALPNNVTCPCPMHACAQACGFKKKDCQQLHQCVAATVLMSSPPVSSPGGPAAAPALAPAPAVQASSGAPAPAPVSDVAVHLPFQALSLPADAAPPLDDFPMDGLPLPFCRKLIDANGGEAAFEG